LSNEEKTNDYENFEKGMIYMKILKKRGVVEKRGRRDRNPCPMRLWFLLFPLSQDLWGYINGIQLANFGLYIDKTLSIYLKVRFKALASVFCFCL
jgi:hypothetical protein